MAGWPTDRALEQAGDITLEHLVRLEADDVLVALGLKEVVEIKQREGGIALEKPPLHTLAILCHHRLQHLAPTIGAVDIAGAQAGFLKIAEVVENEQLVKAGATDVAIVGRAFRLAMSGAYAAVLVEHHDIVRATGVYSINTLARKTGQRRNVLFSGQNLGLEPTHLTGRARLPGHRLPADDPAHRRVRPEPVRIVDILIAREPTEHRLAKLRHQAVTTITAHLAVSQHLTRDSRNSSFSRRSKPTRKSPFCFTRQHLVGRQLKSSLSYCLFDHIRRIPPQNHSSIWEIRAERTPSRFGGAFAVTSAINIVARILVPWEQRFAAELTLGLATCPTGRRARR